MYLSVKNLLRRAAVLGLAVSLAGMSSGSLLAGDVQVALEGSLLKITGSPTADSISLVQTAAGDVFVNAGAGTTVSGRSSVVLRRVSLNAVELMMEGGNDSVTTRGLRVANDFFANLGDGNDRLVTSGPVSVGANWTIEGAGGNDVVRLADAMVGEDLFVDGGIGVLNATIQGLLGGKSLTIISDDAADVISVIESEVADIVSIETKGGNDRITIDTASAFGLAVNADLGIDVVDISNVLTDESIGIFTGPGNDQLTLTNVVSNTTISVSTDAGSDRVSGEAVVAGTDAVLLGGDGTDTLVDLGISGGVKTEIKEFEQLLP